MKGLIDQFLAWWSALEERERRALSIGVVVLALLLLYLLIWAPMQSSVARLAKTVPANRAKLAQMRADATEAGRLRSRVSAISSTTNLLSTLEQTATQQGIRAQITRMDPEGDNGARLSIDNVDFGALVTWLGTLQGQGVRVENANVSRKAAPGVVSAQLSLRAPGK